MLLPLYWCNICNFGDALNKELFLKFGIDSIHFNEYKCYAVGVGSLLENFLYNERDKNFIIPNRAVAVLGSGFGFDVGQYPDRKDIIFPEKLKRKMKCYAVRGELTRKRMVDLGVIKKGDKVALGDFGLLANLLVDGKRIEKKYRLGIVAHYADAKSPIFNKIKKNIKSSVIIDVNSEPTEFMEKISECDAVISTAMHPLIACDSLLIPNRWIRISEKTTSRYKFEDYYSALGIKDKSPLILSNKDFTEKDIVKIIKEYDVSDKVLKKVQAELIRSIEKFKKDFVVENSQVKITFEVLNKKVIGNKLVKKILKFLTKFIPIKKYRKKFRDFINTI